MLETLDVPRYFDRIGYRDTAAPDLATLQALHRLHPQAIAFENLDPLTGRRVHLDAAALQRKLVDEQRGGSCFEHNGLFQLVLREMRLWKRRDVPIRHCVVAWQLRLQIEAIHRSPSAFGQSLEHVVTALSPQPHAVMRRLLLDIHFQS